MNKETQKTGSLAVATGSAGSVLRSVSAWYANLSQPEKDKISYEAKDIVRKADASAKATIAILDGKAYPFLPNTQVRHAAMDNNTQSGHASALSVTTG